MRVAETILVPILVADNRVSAVAIPLLLEQAARLQIKDKAIFGHHIMVSGLGYGAKSFRYWDMFCHIV
tara:strand:+ start:370 stop:573 length:204 start_codon:yes stop_codon:yes gene_type:complete